MSEASDDEELILHDYNPEVNYNLCIQKIILNKN